MKYLLIIYSVFFSFAFYAQQTNDSLRVTSSDSLKKVNTDSIKRAKEFHKKTYSMPRKVTLMSVILPGLGQAYNKHYWKIPLIYAGIGGFGYMFITNNKEYRYYRKNLRAIYDSDTNTVNTTGYSPDNVQLQKVAYRKKRDLAIIGIGAFYLLNVIDANVSAHLKTFDVSDDLSLRIDPYHDVYRTARGGLGISTGLSLKLNFK